MINSLLLKLIYIVLVNAILFVGFTSCAFKSINRHKNITYLPEDSTAGKAAEKLNVFAPKHAKAKEVFIFVYGGNWNSGRKGIYSYFGSRMARKGIITVIVDYPKSPKANYDEMATDIALSVKWVKDNIAKYGGDPEKIFISGHSAGGHLAALISIKKDYFKKLGIANPLKGLILIDAAGLDMYGYLKQENFDAGNTYLQTFTADSTEWKNASPLYWLHKNVPPMLIYRGGRTYESIEVSNEKFVTALKKDDLKFTYHIQQKKKHVPMILQFFNSSNPRYKEIISFMKAN
jgi:acetyl esterase/lipase